MTNIYYSDNETSSTKYFVNFPDTPVIPIYKLSY